MPNKTTKARKVHPVSTQARITSLEDEHANLEKKLREARAHSSADDTEINDLKRKKLAAKDEIARLKQGQTPVTHDVPAPLAEAPLAQAAA